MVRKPSKIWRMDKRTKQTKPLPHIRNRHRENRAYQNPNQNKTLPHTRSRLPHAYLKKERVTLCPPRSTLPDSLKYWRFRGRLQNSSYSKSLSKKYWFWHNKLFQKRGGFAGDFAIIGRYNRTVLRKLAKVKMMRTLKFLALPKPN